MVSSAEDYQKRCGGDSNSWIKQNIIAQTEFWWKGDVLDIGTGKGGWSQFLLETGRFNSVSAVDIVDAREEKSDKIPFATCDLAKEALPFAVVGWPAAEGGNCTGPGW